MRKVATNNESTKQEYQQKYKGHNQRAQKEHNKSTGRFILKNHCDKK